MRIDSSPPEQSVPLLRKGLGQHHLRDPQLCQPVIEFIQPIRRPVLEVGSGGGVLTQALVGSGAAVVALDLDLHWLVEGRRRLAKNAETDSPRQPIHWLAADALQFDWRPVPADWSVVGNLPYNVATPIIRAVLRQGSVGRMAFLIQKEVAQRIIASPGSKNYGLLSLMVSWWAEASILGTVKPGSFHPPPKVDSQFVGLVRRRPPGATDEYQQMLEVASLAFSHRRKTLANSLRARFATDRVTAWCCEAGLSPTTRPENLSLEHYRSLASKLFAEAPR